MQPVAVMNKQHTLTPKPRIILCGKKNASAELDCLGIRKLEINAAVKNRLIQ
jgi:hypothetical protein